MRVMVDDLDVAALASSQLRIVTSHNDLSVADEQTALLDIGECFRARLAGEWFVVKGQNAATQ